MEILVDSIDVCVVSVLLRRFIDVSLIDDIVSEIRWVVDIDSVLTEDRSFVFDDEGDEYIDVCWLVVVLSVVVNIDEEKVLIGMIVDIDDDWIDV